MIKIDSVTKKFNNRVVLDNVSLTLKNGEITSVIGLNGAGKSTLISLIMNYKRVNSGVIERESVSVMPDAECMIENMTGEEFLRFIAGIKKNILDESEYLILAERLFIKENLNKKIKTYSFGMKKKISFIQAYIGDFDTYIFDEPTSGVDVESARVMMSLLRELKLMGKSILLTSHNIDELQEVSDYVYVLKKGKIVEKGTVEEIRHQKHEKVYLLTFKNPTKSDFASELQDFQYSLGCGDWDEGTLEVYSNDLENINLLIKVLFEHNCLIEDLSKYSESLKEAVFEKED